MGEGGEREAGSDGRARDWREAESAGWRRRQGRGCAYVTGRSGSARVTWTVMFSLPFPSSLPHLLCRLLSSSSCFPPLPLFSPQLCIVSVCGTFFLFFFRLHPLNTPPFPSPQHHQHHHTLFIFPPKLLCLFGWVTSGVLSPGAADQAKSAAAAAVVQTHTHTHQDRTLCLISLSAALARLWERHLAQPIWRCRSAPTTHHLSDRPHLPSRHAPPCSPAVCGTRP